MGVLIQFPGAQVDAGVEKMARLVATELLGMRLRGANGRELGELLDSTPFKARVEHYLAVLSLGIEEGPGDGRVA